MAFWSDQVVPRLIDVFLGTEDVRRLRERALAGASGVVVELGFGSGTNLPAYPATVSSVLAVEPSPVARKLAGKQLAHSPLPVDFVGLNGESLPLDDESADTVVSTFTMCTIPNLDAALGEVRRVLKPGGRFLFLEHGRAANPSVQRWQTRLTPLQRRLFDGCHLDRAIDERITDAGLAITDLGHDRLPGPRFLEPMAYLYLGSAARSA